MTSGSDSGLMKGCGKSLEHREPDRGGALGKARLFLPSLHYGKIDDQQYPRQDNMMPSSHQS